MDGLEIRDRGGAAPVPEVAAHADVARARTLSPTSVCERVLDGDTLAQSSATGARVELRAEAFLERLVVGDGDAAAIARRGVGAAGAQQAVVAALGVELDGGAEGE